MLHYRTPLAQRLLGAFALAVIAPLALGLTVVSWMAAGQPLAPLLVLIACACFQWLLVVYVGRDTLAKWGYRAMFDDSGVALRLPRARSLIHRPPRFNGRVAYADVAAIETRLESYRSFGLSAMQRSYVLRRNDGTAIFLGESRALGTTLAQADVGHLVEELRVRANVPIVDKGMVEGRGGFLLVFGAQPGSWTAPSLDAARQAVLWRRAAFTGSLAGTVMLLGLLLSWIFSR